MKFSKVAVIIYNKKEYLIKLDKYKMIFGVFLVDTKVESQSHFVPPNKVSIVGKSIFQLPHDIKHSPTHLHSTLDY